MTIYILDNNPKECAEKLANKDLIKMIKDIAQVLCNVHWELSLQSEYATYLVKQYTDTIPLKPRLSTKGDWVWVEWACECKANYDFLRKLGETCVEEFYWRMNDFGNIKHSVSKMKMDKFSDAIYWARDNVPNLIILDEWENGVLNGIATPFPLVMPKKFQLKGRQHTDNNTIAVVSYRDYYKAKLVMHISHYATDTINTSEKEWKTIVSKFWTNRTPPEFLEDIL